MGASAPRARTDPDPCRARRSAKKLAPGPQTTRSPCARVPSSRKRWSEPHGVGRAKRIRWSPCPRVLARKQVGKHYSWCGAVTWCRRRAPVALSSGVRASSQGFRTGVRGEEGLHGSCRILPAGSWTGRGKLSLNRTATHARPK